MLNRLNVSSLNLSSLNLSSLRFLLAIGLIVLVRSTFASHYYIPSESMLPKLEIGDQVLVYKRAYREKDPNRGDVIVFPAVDGSGTLLIKRVIGLPGDVIEMDEEGIAINGELAQYEFLELQGSFILQRECVIQHCREVRRSLDVLERARFQGSFSRRLHIPEGQLFVLGDNRDESADSRFWGFVPLDSVVGQAKRVMWNLDFQSFPPQGDLSRVGEKL